MQTRQRQSLSRAEAIEFGAGGIDADKDGLFKRADVCRLISAYRSITTVRNG